MIVVDIETSGLYPESCAILSIGAVDFSDPRRQFFGSARVWNGCEIYQGALEVNGTTIDQLLDDSLPTEKDLVEKFIEWLRPSTDYTMAGENVAAFDIPFIKAAMKRGNIKPEWLHLGHRVVDMHSVCFANYLSRGLIPPLKDNKTDLNSDKIMKYAGMPEEPKPHIAINGAKMEAEALCRLIKGRSLFEEFANHPIPDYLKHDRERHRGRKK